MADKNDLLFDKPKLENGGQSQEAIVVTSPDKQHVNAPTVEDIQRIAKGIAEKEAEAASATEWEKSVKDHISYDEEDENLVFTVDDLEGYMNDSTLYFVWNANSIEIAVEERYIDLVGSWTIGSEERAINYVYVENIIDDDGNGVETAHLLDGARIYKHRILIDDTQSDYAFYFEFYNSSPDEIDNVDVIAYNKQFELCPGMFVDRNTTPYTHEVGIISEIDQGDIHILHGTTEHIFYDPVVTDTVTQC